MCVCVVCVGVRPHRFWKISAPVYLLYKVTIKGTFEHVLPAIFSTPSTFIICAVSQKAASTCVREHILVRASTCILARERILVREGRPSWVRLQHCRTSCAVSLKPASTCVREHILRREHGGINLLAAAQWLELFIGPQRQARRKQITCLNSQNYVQIWEFAVRTDYVQILKSQCPKHVSYRKSLYRTFEK